MFEKNCRSIIASLNRNVDYYNQHGKKITAADDGTRYVNYDKILLKKNNIFTKEARFPKPYKHRSFCCGCTACFANCPMQAISMEPDREGFLYPVIDLSKCVLCMKCESICPIKEE